MTIQFDGERMVRVGDKFFPAQPFVGMDSRIDFGVGIGYTIPLGESGKSLSIAIGCGTYNEHHLIEAPHRIEPTTEMDRVEVGFNFGGERDFDVTGWIDDEELSRIIIRAMSGEDPF